MVLFIREREFSYKCVLSLVLTMNLSNSNLLGNILEELTSLHGLISLNLSKNHLEGNICVCETMIISILPQVL